MFNGITFKNKINMIKKAKKEQLLKISLCLKNSKLETNYFNNPENIINFLTDAINKNELYIYENNKNILGFMRIDPNGMFSRFPLLRCIAVHPEFRNNGIGKKLLEHFENLSKEKNNIIFLCVSDFNNEAKRLYLSQDYKEIGKIKDLYKKDITEYILSKVIKD